MVLPLPDVLALPNTHVAELLQCFRQRFGAGEVVRDFPKVHVPSVPYFDLLLEIEDLCLIVPINNENTQ